MIHPVPGQTNPDRIEGIIKRNYKSNNLSFFCATITAVSVRIPLMCDGTHGIFRLHLVFSHPSSIVNNESQDLNYTDDVTRNNTQYPH